MPAVVSASRPSPAPTARPADAPVRRSSLLPFVALAVVVAAWCALGTQVRATFGGETTADEPQYLLSAISLFEDLDLDISDELRDERWRAFHSPGELPEQTKPIADGRRMSPHDPLLAAILAVPAGVGGRVGAKLAMAAMAGLLAALVAWVANRGLGVSTRIAVGGTALFAMAPPLAVYGTQIYPELPAALAVTAAIAGLTAAEPRRGAALVAVAVVALPWLSVKYVAVAAVLGLLLLARLVRGDARSTAVRVAGALAAAGLVYLLFHRAVYGGWTAYASGDHFTAGEASVMGFSPNLPGRSRRLAGLLTDRAFGLVPWAPLYLVAVAAVGAVLRARRRWAPALLLPLAAGWLMATFAALTMHGFWWPGRQVVVILPTLVLAALWHADRSPAVARIGLVAGAAGAVTFLWLVGQGLARDLTWVTGFAGTSNPLYRLWRPLLPDGGSGAPIEVVRHVLWVAVLLALVALGWHSQAPISASPTPRRRSEP